MSWDYRVGTKMISTENTPQYPNGWRKFFVFECYYNEYGIPDAYCKREPLSGWDNLSDLIGTVEKIHEMISKNKPVIDLDNFPNEFLT